MGTIAGKEAQSERLATFIRERKAKYGSVTEFDSKLLGSMVDFVAVSRKKEMVFNFKDGTEIQG